jgi:nucleotide-binding universal stress UspA family protein
MYSRIIVPLDGSQNAEEILPHVEELASKYRSKLVLLRVVEIRIPVTGPDLVSIPGTVEQIKKSIEGDRNDAETYLADVTRRMQANGIGAEARVAYGPVVTTIVTVAKEEKADLLAMASHGRTGAACVFYGCVASGVLHRIEIPVLIVRSPK